MKKSGNWPAGKSKVISWGSTAGIRANKMCTVVVFGSRLKRVKGNRKTKDFGWADCMLVNGECVV